MKRRHWLAAGISGSLAIAACGTSHSTTGQHATSQPSTSQAANPCPPGACGAPVTSAHTGGAGSPSGDSLHTWGVAHLATLMGLSDQATQLGRSAGTAQQLASGCNQLGSTVQTALQIPPPPDGPTATHLHNGLTQLQQFARDCSAAFSGDAAAGSRMLAEETHGTSELNLAIQAVQRS